MTSTGDITVELMQQILREVEKDNTIVVLPSLVVHELNDDLHGGSCIIRVNVTYTTSRGTSQHTLSLIVKVLPRNSASADTVQRSSHFVREIQMFEEILPRMSVLLAWALPGRRADFNARVYYTRKTPTYLIAIHDLSPRGFKAPKRKIGLDMDHSLLALKTLARFHASSVMIKRQDESLFSVFYMHAFQENGFAEVMSMMSGKVLPIVCRAIESWPEFGRSWADQVRHRYKNLYEELECVWKRDDSSFNVLNHGDFGKHNMMYRHSEPSGEVEAIMLVDFQCCSYNSPVLDLHQFIFSSASEEVMANHIYTLLREYHAELTATLEALGAPREQTITLTQLLDDFDSKMLYAFFYATCLLPLLSIDTETYPGLTPEELFNDSGDGTDKIQSLLADTYYTSLRKLLPIFRQKNIL